MRTQPATPGGKVAAAGMPVGFTHLHVHSSYSLLGGTASVVELARRAAAEGMGRLALTDTNVLYGAVAFSRACADAGIQPILGMVLATAWPDDLPQTAVADGRPGYVVLLARNFEGYRSLCRLSSQIQGRPDRDLLGRQGVKLADLQAQSAGLICIEAGRQGWVSRLQRGGDGALARRYLGRLAGIYESGLYMGLELHRAEDFALMREVAGLGDFLGVPTVAVQPVYCLEPEGRARLRLLAAIDANCSIDAVANEDLPDGGNSWVTLHWLGAEEIQRRFGEHPGAVERAGEVAELCEPALPTGRVLWPGLGLVGLSPEEAMVRDAREGLIERYGATPPESVIERLERELAAVTAYGYTPLFLIVADIVRYAREMEIPVSTRGSVANSLVAYCMKITTVDPIAHDLLFERFLSPARPDLPDIDLDFCSRRRDEVLGYVRKRYGADRVALVATISTFRPRSAAREVGKALGLKEEQLRRLMAAMPDSWGWGPRRGELTPLSEVLAKLDDAEVKRAAREAYGIIGLPHHLSVHPGGVVIAPEQLTDVVPVQWAPKGFVITQFDHSDVEMLGLPKIDLLGVRALTVLSDAVELVRRDAVPGFDPADIPLDDRQTQAHLCRGDTIGVFQCESEGARRTLRKLRARSVHDLAVANAFFKPGPATGGMADEFVRRYRGEGSVAYMHPTLEPILGRTKGVLIFQEQVLRVAREIAGLSWEQAGYLRRGISKMDRSEMARMQAEFEAGCQRAAPDGPGMSPQMAHQLWEQVSAFSGYGFNEGHATAYADVSYRSAYIRAHWPAAFLCARLRDWGGYHHPAVYIAEAFRLGIEVRLPHVNSSLRGYGLFWEGQQAVIRMGLDMVRDLRRESIVGLVSQRRGRPYSSVGDMAMRVPLQAKEIEHLIQGGALDGLGATRAAMLDEAERVHRAGSAQQMAFDLGEAYVVRESVAQQAVWEKLVLGFPLGAVRRGLVALRAQYPHAVQLAELDSHPNQRIEVLGVRLPGWGRRSQLYLWDGPRWVLVRLPEGLVAPPAWEPVKVGGHWRLDHWGGTWLQAESVQRLTWEPAAGSE